MTTVLCDVFVPGEPVGQGRISYNRGGRGYHANAKKLDPWRALVGTVTRWGYQARGGVDPHDGPVRLDLGFWLPRPKTARRPFPSVRSDLDHLVRAVGDALVKGCVLADDALICDLAASKRYADDEHEAGVRIVVATL